MYVNMYIYVCICTCMCVKKRPMKQRHIIPDIIFHYMRLFTLYYPTRLKFLRYLIGTFYKIYCNNKSGVSSP